MTMVSGNAKIELSAFELDVLCLLLSQHEMKIDLPSFEERMIEAISSLKTKIYHAQHNPSTQQTHGVDNG